MDGKHDGMWQLPRDNVHMYTSQHR